MKQYIIGAVLLAVLGMSCTKEDVAAEQTIEGKKIFASTDTDTSRTYFEEQNGRYIHKWQTDDYIGVFDKTTAVSEYLLIEGADSENGTFLQVSMPEGGSALNQAYAIYPLSANNKMTAEGVFRVAYPEIQTYSSEHTASYCYGSNILVAASASSESFSFRNACGFLEVKLCGEGITVKNIVLQGNKLERIAGDAIVSYKGTTDPKTTMLSTAKTSITIDCGDGVQLDGTLPTSFVFALPPTTFSEGFSIRITDADGKFFEKRTDKTIDVVRNVIQSMASIVCEMTIPTNQIWYRSSSTITPTNVGKILANEYDSATGYRVITFNEEITTVGGSAFRDKTTLQSILLPASITAIGTQAFYGCTKLENVITTAKLTTIENSAFYGCAKLTQIPSLEEVENIGQYAFYQCAALTNVVLGEKLTSIGTYAFSGCTSIKTVSLPNCLQSCGSSAFANCIGLEQISIGDGLASISGSMFNGCIMLSQINWGNNIASIGNSAFSGCSNLKTIHIPMGVTSIGSSAFNGCSSVESVFIPSSVIMTTSNYKVFTDCTGELSIHCNIPDATYSPYDPSNTMEGPFYRAKFHKINIGNEVKHIGNAGFIHNSSLIKVIGGKNVVSIGNYAFYACNLLENNEPLNATSIIGREAFCGCDNLSEVQFSDALETISYGSFWYCSSLTDVVIPSNTKNIGRYAFDNCDKLETVTCLPTNPPAGDYNMFDSDVKIYIPAASLDEYKKASYWRDFQSQMEAF